MSKHGLIAFLAMAVIINGSGDDDSVNRNAMKLWGLVVCHHTSPRCIPFPLCYAYEFLMQAFGLQLNMELQLASQLSEKHVLKTQTLLCDMLLHDSPTGIATQSPSIIDLVKCDGAALYYQGKYWPLGITPTEAQIKEIVEWLEEGEWQGEQGPKAWRTRVCELNTTKGIFYLIANISQLFHSCIAFLFLLPLDFKSLLQFRTSYLQEAKGTSYLAIHITSCICCQKCLMNLPFLSKNANGCLSVSSPPMAL